MNNFSNNPKKGTQTPINRQIRGSKVFCIDHEGTSLGLIDINKALEIAQNNGLDLVQINYNIKEQAATCKILDYGKFKYQNSLNEKAAKKRQRESEVKTKEIKIRPQTEQHDLEIKAKKAQEILDDGDRVKISIVFKGREIHYKDNAYETYNNFIALLPDMNIIEPANLSGKILTAVGIKKSQ